MSAHTKDFDRWNERKKQLNDRMLPNDFYFLEGEVWWAALGVNIGHEIDGKNDLFERPILVIKKISEDMLLALPITTKKKAGVFVQSIIYKNMEQSVILHQSRSISSKRLLRLIFRITDQEFCRLKDAIKLVMISGKTIPSD